MFKLNDVYYVDLSSLPTIIDVNSRDITRYSVKSDGNIHKLVAHHD